MNFIIAVIVIFFTAASTSYFPHEATHICETKAKPYSIEKSANRRTNHKRHKNEEVPNKPQVTLTMHYIKTAKSER